MKFTALPTVCALGALLSAQEIQSGPAIGMKLTKVNAYAASGPYQGKEFDAAAALGQGPGALLFVKALNRETAPIIRGLDNLAAEFSLLGFKSFTMMLTDDRTAGEARIKTLSKALNMRNPMTVSLDGAEGPGNYAINRNANLTLVMVKGGVVTKCLAFTDTGLKDLPLITAAVESVAGKLPTTAKGRVRLLPNDIAKLKKMVTQLWADNDQLKRQLANQSNRRNRGNRNMRRGRQDGKQGDGQMRRRGADQRGGNQRGSQRNADNAGKKQLPGTIPADSELVGLLRTLIRAKTKDEIDNVFESVDKAVGDSAEKREAMVQGFIRILGATTYGTDDARARAMAYCQKGGQRRIDDKKATEAARKQGGQRADKRTGSDRPRQRRDIKRDGKRKDG